MFIFRHLVVLLITLLALLSGASIGQETAHFKESVAIVVLDVFESSKVVEVPVSHTCDPDLERYDSNTMQCESLDDDGVDDTPNCAANIEGLDDYQYEARFYSTLLKPFQDPHGRLIYAQYQSYLQELGAELYPPVDPGWNADLFQEWRLPDNTRIYLIGVDLFVEDKPYETSEIEERVLEIVNHRTLYNIPLPPIENFIFSMSFALVPCNQHAFLTAHDYACELAKDQYKDMRTVFAESFARTTGHGLPMPADCEDVSVKSLVATVTPTFTPTPDNSEDSMDADEENQSQVIVNDEPMIEQYEEELIAMLSRDEFLQLQANVIFNYGRPRVQQGFNESYPEQTITSLPEFLIDDPLFGLNFTELGTSTPQTLALDLAESSVRLAEAASDFSEQASSSDESTSGLSTEFAALSARFAVLSALHRDNNISDDFDLTYTGFADEALSFTASAIEFAEANGGSAELIQNLAILESNFGSLRTSSDEVDQIFMDLAVNFARLATQFAILESIMGDDLSRFADGVSTFAGEVANYTNEVSMLLRKFSSQAFFVPDVDVVAIAAAGNDGKNYPYAPALSASVLSVSAEYTGVDACYTMLNAQLSTPLQTNAGELRKLGFYNCLPGTSFAVPRMGIEVAIYLLMGGSPKCDTTNPPLSYIPDWTNPPKGVDLTGDPLTGVNLTREAAATEYCPDFNTLVEEFYDQLS